MRFPTPPAFSSLPAALKDYFIDWFTALFTEIENYTEEQLEVVGTTGDASGQISRMGRTASVLVRFTGAATGASFRLPVRPLGVQVLHVSRMTTVPTVLGVAGVDENGIVSLPNFTDGADVLVSGIILERD